MTCSTFQGIIAVGEMLAIERCINHALSISSSPPKLILLATDNMNCKHWIERGYAKNQEINEIMRRIYSVLDGKKIRLFVTYVPTDDNVADDFTRPVDGKETQLNPEKLAKTHQVLQKAFVESTAGMWLISGGLMGTAVAQEWTMRRKISEI